MFVTFEGVASTSMSDKVVEQQGKAPLVFNKSSSQNRPQISHEFRATMVPYTRISHHATCV